MASNSKKSHTLSAAKNPRILFFGTNAVVLRSAQDDRCSAQDVSRGGPGLRHSNPAEDVILSAAKNPRITLCQTSLCSGLSTGLAQIRALSPAGADDCLAVSAFSRSERILVAHTAAAPLR